MKKTEILFILDRSTSMGGVAHEAVEGFNAFLKTQKKNSKGKRLTLLQFDDKLEYIYQSKKLKDCDPLVVGESYIIQGCTALLDAIGTGLNKIRKAKKAIVAIYTDGHENMSKEWDSKTVKKALAKAERKGWEVIYLSADVDTTTYATQTLGLKSNRVSFVNKGDILSNINTISNRTTLYSMTGLASAADLQTELDEDSRVTA